MPELSGIRTTLRSPAAGNREEEPDEPPICEKCGERHYHRTKVPPSIKERGAAGNREGEQGEADSGGAA